MSSLPQLAAALQQVLTEEAAAAARETGVTQRRSKLSAAVLVQTLVLGWLANPQASLHELTQVAAKLGVALSPQGLDQRFGAATAALLERVLAAAVAIVIGTDPVTTALLARFTGVTVLDSTTVALPDALAGRWLGCGGRTRHGTQAALKLTVQLDLRGGPLGGPELSPGRTQDRATTRQHAPVAAGALRITDLGFRSLEVFRAIGAGGAFWLSRLNLQVRVFAPAGHELELGRWLRRQPEPSLEAPVRLGVAAQVPARLLAVRVPAAKREGKTPPAAALARAGWTLLVTNVPATQLSVPEALVLARARWQIELLFKLWKSHGALAESRSTRPWRVLCEVYAKLVAMVIHHWLLLVGCWQRHDRSLVQAAQTVRREAACLVGALGTRRRLVTALRDICRCLATGCRLNHRRTKPSTAQLLADPTLAGLA